MDKNKIFCYVPLRFVVKGGLFFVSLNSHPFVKGTYIKILQRWRCSCSFGFMHFSPDELVYSRFDQLKRSAHD